MASSGTRISNSSRSPAGFTNMLILTSDGTSCPTAVSPIIDAAIIEIAAAQTKRSRRRTSHHCKARQRVTRTTRLPLFHWVRWGLHGRAHVPRMAQRLLHLRRPEHTLIARLHAIDALEDELLKPF